MIHKNWAKLGVAAVAMVCSSAILMADQITMKNGDRVTGSIVKKDATTLTIKTVHFGVVTLPWGEVESVVADKPVTVVLPNDKTVEATLATSNGKIDVNAKDGKQTVEPKDVVAIRNADEQKAYLRMLHPKLTDLWVITGNVGIAGASGNASTRTFTVPVNFVRATRTDKITAYFNFIRSAATVNGVTADTASAVRGGLGYSRNLAPKVFANFFNDYEYDRFQSLDLRAVFGGGLGWHAWKNEKGFLDVLGGGAYNRQTYGPANAASYSVNVAEVYWGDDFGYKPSKRVSLTESYRMFNNMTATGNYRQNFDAGLGVSLNKAFTWNLAISDRYISNPVPGRKNNDFLYSTGFGFTFAK